MILLLGELPTTIELLLFSPSIPSPCVGRDHLLSGRGDDEDAQEQHRWQSQDGQYNILTRDDDLFTMPYPMLKLSNLREAIDTLSHALPNSALDELSREGIDPTMPWRSIEDALAEHGIDTVQTTRRAVISLLREVKISDEEASDFYFFCLTTMKGKRNPFYNVLASILVAGIDS